MSPQFPTRSAVSTGSFTDARRMSTATSLICIASGSVASYPLGMCPTNTSSKDTNVSSSPVAQRTLCETSRRLKRRMLDKARDIHIALALSRLSKIIRGLHPQPHVSAATESLFKAQRHLRRDGASTLHHVVKLL